MTNDHQTTLKDRLVALIDEGRKLAQQIEQLLKEGQDPQQLNHYN